MSTLNPNAAEYVPLFKRGTDSQSHGFNACTEDVNSRKQHGSEQPSLGHGAEMSPEGYYQGYGSYSESPQKLSGKGMLDDESVMELEYLQMEFPGVSEESIVEAYLANNCDFDGTVEMLDHLESDIVEPSGNLPDTLDIGDIPESSFHTGDVKVKNVAGESSTSSSCRSRSTIISFSAE